MVDQRITCTVCGRRFTWAAGEQQFYARRGLEQPRRCPDCRPSRGQRGAAAARPRPRGPSPYQIFGAATLAAALALLAALLLLRVPPPLAWLIAANAVAFLTYGYDKMIAGRGGLRSPERVLLGLALAGGSLGALLAMLLFRHKTDKPPFLRAFWLIVALQAALLLGWLTLRAGR